MRRIDPKIQTAIVTTAATAFLAWVLGFAFGATYPSGCEHAVNAGAVFGCFEFILFRYQTLIGVFAALGTALIAAEPVWRQLRELRRQSAFQHYEMLRRHKSVVEEDWRLTWEVKREANYATILERNIADNPLLAPDSAAFKTWVSYIEERRDALSELLRTLEIAGVNKWGDTEALNARGVMLIQITVLRAAVSQAGSLLSGVVARNESMASQPQPRASAMWIADTKKIRELTLVDASNQLEKAANNYAALIDKERLRLAPLIANAERLATADDPIS
jgi:hypothetical protein